MTIQTLEQKLNIGIDILKFCINENKNLTIGCLKFGKQDKYLRYLKKDSRPRNESEKKLMQEFLTYYNQYLTKRVKITTEETLILNSEVLDGMEEMTKAFLSPDTIIETESSKITDTSNNTKELDFRGNEVIKTTEQLIEAAKIDLNIWKVDKKIANVWDVTMRGSDGEPLTAQNFQVKLWLSKIRSDDEQKAWDNFLNSIADSAPDLSYLQKPASKQGKKYMLEISIPDLHIGKLAHEDEVGENYDTKIAIDRYKVAVDKLLNHVSHYKDQIEEILFPIGNDLLQIDKMEGTTTAGTKVDTDSRWQQMFLKAKELCIGTINKLAAIAPVRVVMVSGNHDNQTIFYLGEVLVAYYRNNTETVILDNSPFQRKYHRYGINLIGFTHGNEEKHQDLGLLMATEQPDMWAATRFRQFHLGHFHSRKTTKYVDVNEFQGFQIRILPSLSSSDKWHNTKGYISIKSAVAFLYDKENGMISEFSHNVF
jgi:hypothetical protein